MVITEIFNTEYPLKSTEIEDKNGTAVIKLPYFFPESENQLFLIAAEYKGSVYLSDNGSAFRELSARTDDAYVTGDVFTYLAGVYLNIKPNEKKEIVWAVSPGDMRRFYRFLQCVSICANADLYPFIDENKYAECSAYVTRFDFPSGAYPAEFAEAVRTSLYPKYEKLITPFTFSGESSAMCVKAEETRDGGVSLTDAGGFDGGDLIEYIKWNNRDDYHQFDAMILRVCGRFGAEYDGRKVRYTVPRGKSYTRAVFTLMQTAAILGELGVTVKTE